MGPSAPAPVRRRRLGRILVVDGDAGARQLIAAMLAKAGYAVVEAENAERAIAHLALDQNPQGVDVILCDLRMPKFKGIEAVAYFRARYPSLPTIVLTTYPDIEAAIALMKQGAMDYLVKPVSRDDLLFVIASAIGHRGL